MEFNHAVMNTIEVDLKKIKPYKNNAKKHGEVQIANVAESISQFGFRQPIVLDKNNVIIIGHCRWLAAKKLKLDTVPVHYANDLTEEQTQKLRILDNKLNESEWDFDLLKLDAESISFDGFDIDLGFPIEEETKEIVEDIPPEVDNESEPITELGDIWQLGEHRLICGDSTDKKTVLKLLNGVKADMVFTDPPYGVNVKGGKGKGNFVMGDLTQTVIPFSFEIAVEVATKDKAHFYFCGGESNLQLYQKLFDRYLHMLPKHLIWVKNGFVMKQNGYHNQFEIIFHGYKQGSGALWFSGRTENEASDVWQVKRDASSTYLHPTQKPTDLPARAIRNSSPKGAIVFEPFCGSGSTLIACEQLERVCYAVELDPRYCDVIVKRWETLTGKKAVKILQQIKE